MVDLRQNEVLVGSDVSQYPEDLDIELLDLAAFKDGQSVALHSLLDLRQRKDLSG